MLDHSITAYDEGFINEDLLSKGRDLVNTAVKLINGYMKYLKKAGNKPSVSEEPGEYVIKYQED